MATDEEGLGETPTAEAVDPSSEVTSSLVAAVPEPPVPPPLTDDFAKKAADTSLDLAKQFLTLAFAGIAFAVGLSFNTPGAVTTRVLWWVIGSFGASAALGLVFLMHFVSLVGVSRSYNIYGRFPRLLSILQIVLMIFGAVLLVAIIRRHSVAAAPVTHTIQIKLDAQHSVSYPVDQDKNLVVEFDSGRIRVTTSK
jgi:hypothetical protein